MVLLRPGEAGLLAPSPREYLESTCSIWMLVSSQAEQDYRERSQASLEQCAHESYHVPPAAREYSALRFLSLLKGCFLEAEPMAVLTPPCHVYTVHLPPCNSFFFFFWKLRTS